MLRVVLAEDNALLRAGVASVLDTADGIDLVGTAEDEPTLLALVAETDPDVVVTDIRMPPTATD
ncbi:MAG TPA: response regulator, partial [Acidimicrobiales bacterium]|nr:response regulator [Acidimicrobiales bacterium]